MLLQRRTRLLLARPSLLLLRDRHVHLRSRRQRRRLPRHRHRRVSTRRQRSRMLLRPMSHERRRGRDNAPAPASHLRGPSSVLRSTILLLLLLLLLWWYTLRAIWRCVLDLRQNLVLALS